MSVYASRYARAFADVVESRSWIPLTWIASSTDFAATWNGSAETA